MSYLDLPRLHFTATFTADPSTINNNPTNYNEPARSHEGQGTTTTSVQLWWNPYGSGAWSIPHGSVTSYVIDASNVITDGDDPILGATVRNSTAAYGSSAKLVDLDPDEQTRTRLFGLILEFTDHSGKLLFSGYFEQEGCLKNLWFARVPSNPGDSGAGGVFQSVMKFDASGPRQLRWGESASHSPFLLALRQASEAGGGLSINLTTFAYDASPQSPTFRQGQLWGTIGPITTKDEPKHQIAKRMLSPTPMESHLGQVNSLLWNAPAALDELACCLSIDLGNALPEQSVGGPPIDLGDMQVALHTDEGWTLLCPLDYTSAKTTAGVFVVPLEEGDIERLKHHPLAILTTKGSGIPVETTEGPMFIAIQEQKDGLYITTDRASVYMNPGNRTAVDLYATRFGQPLPNHEVPLELIPTRSGDINNKPGYGLSFPEYVTTDTSGVARIPLLAADPIPKTQRRQNINGQVYFIGGAWSKQVNANQQTPSSLSVKVFNSSPIPETPTWADVGPILYQFYILYGTMAGRLDLSNYEKVKNSCIGGANPIMKTLINLPFDNPKYMPVTRELSRDDLQILNKWIDCGCPASAGGVAANPVRSL